LYSFGRLDPEALRSFLTYAYFNWNGEDAPPRYVLLVGDGHYDFKNALGKPLANLVPPYLIDIDPWIGETAADNRYVSVDGPADYLPNMAIGRISAQTPGEVTAAVDKILAFENPTAAPPGAWQNMVTFVADQADDASGNFQAFSEDARLSWLPSSYNSRHIYWETDYTTASSMESAIKNAFTDSLMVQWFGHASRFRWGTVSGIFNILSVPNIPSSSQWPITLDYSCYTGYFINLDNPGGTSDYHSLAEKLQVTAGKGSVATIAPSGKHVGDALLVLNDAFIESILRDEIQTVGDAFDAAKAYYAANAVAWFDVIDTTILFGDPATKLRLIPRVSVTRSADPSAADLAWRDLAPYVSYQVWRGETPYFQPGIEGAQVGSVPGGSPPSGEVVTFTDDGSQPAPGVVVIGDPVHNYFWAVRDVNTGGSAVTSNRVGEFDFALAPGEPPAGLARNATDYP
jgi:hypothetical protein